MNEELPPINILNPEYNEINEEDLGNQEPSREGLVVPNEMFSINKYLAERERGLKTHLVPSKLTSKFYCSFDEYQMIVDPPNRKYGGIFNLEYSRDGRLLVAACEVKSVLIHDAGNQKIVHTIPEAHINSVNCIRFINDNQFVTGSDDRTVKIWDLRNTNDCFKVLKGHDSWVKNIEYCERENILVTSAFDGKIYAWNLFGGTFENISEPCSDLFRVDSLMRMKLSPDCSKMIISTTSGYMIIIHDLNLRRMGLDLKLFKPGLYRLMQITQQNFPAGNMLNFYFQPHRKPNRVEFIEDFPNACEVICSLQIHPHGWCALSRNVNALNSDEYTVVHDIQAKDPSEYDDAYTVVTEEQQPTSGPQGGNNLADIWVTYCQNQTAVSRHWMRYGDTQFMQPEHSGLIGRRMYQKYFDRYPQHKDKIIRNFRRMTHFKEESMAGKGYIKEVCFSADGRLICSPYNKGVRLLGFSKNIDEISACLSEKPQELETIVDMKNYHKDVVVCCKFNPFHMQLVSGCLGGDIKWYQPVV